MVEISAMAITAAGFKLISTKYAQIMPAYIAKCLR